MTPNGELLPEGMLGPVVPCATPGLLHMQKSACTSSPFPRSFSHTEGGSGLHWQGERGKPSIIRCGEPGDPSTGLRAGTEGSTGQEGH